MNNGKRTNVFLFFFSSRRRHTRSLRDWSSDVCSSDLQDPAFYQRLTASLDFVAVQPELPRLLAKAKEKKVGVIAMKTLRGARLNDLRAYERGGNTFAQAAFRWVLSGPHVDALVVTMTSTEQVDEYLGASGATGVSGSDLELLARYEARNGTTQCRYGCGTCLAACPEGVAID